MDEFARQSIEEWRNLPPYFGAHIELTMLALAIGLMVSLPLGVAAARSPRLERVALGVASVLQTIPGLALLALMVAFLGGLGGWLEAHGLPAPSSIGFLPAVVALSLYSVLPMLRNIVTGLSGVDPALREAALGVGMSESERLWQVELPLALPSIVAGIRTASVWVVGTATLATPVGAASLGNPIFAGLQTRNLSAVVVGSLAAAGLAMLLDGLIRGLEVGLRQRSRRRVAGCSVALALLTGVGVYWGSAEPYFQSRGGEARFEVVVGAKSFTEQYILTELIEGILTEEERASVETLPSLGSIVAFDALADGSLDVYVDYTGTIWATIFRLDTVGTDRREVLEAVRRRLPAEFGMHVLAALGFENTYALAMRREQAKTLGIERISDLRPHAARLEIASDYEFFARAEWAALESQYGLRFKTERGMDASLMYEAVRSQSVDVIGAYSTDGRIAAYDLVVLEDDLGVIPPYDAIVVGSGRLVREAPALADRLRRLEGRLDAETMRRMNAAVDLEGESPAAVAKAWRAGEGAWDGPG
jgi:osmoprotectant transport system permease protein